MAYQTIDTFTGKLVTSYPDATPQEVEQALSAGQAFYREAQHTSVRERTHWLAEIAQELRTHAHHYAATITDNMGKLLPEALAEVNKAADFIQYYADHGEKLLADRPYQVPQHKAYVHFQSIGIVLAVEPWNFPFTQVARVLGPNLLLGNALILKHASIVPGCAASFEEAVRATSTPQGAFHNLFLTHDQIKSVIQDERVQGVALTGSGDAGRHIAAEAGQALVKSTMELGGNDVFMVLADADPQQAAHDAIKARFANAGQVCTSAKRFLVAHSIYDDFMETLIQDFKTYRLGDPRDPHTTLAPLSSKSAQEELLKATHQAIEHGAKVLAGYPEPVEGPGNGFNPLILQGLSHENPLYDHEFFGPVIQVYSFEHDEDALKLANDSQYGLGGAVYSQDFEHAQLIAHQIETGQVAINQGLTSYPEVPFGGVKTSGYGRELSDFGAYEFANIKTILA